MAAGGADPDRVGVLTASNGRTGSRRLHPRALVPNYHGDTVWLSGVVSAVRGDEQLVDIAVATKDQLGDQIVDGMASVQLPKTPDDRHRPLPGSVS